MSVNNIQHLDRKPERKPWRRPHRLLVGLLAVMVALAACGGGDAGEVDEITVDWAYYNPVSLVLKDKGWIEEELPGVTVNWVQSAGSNKAIEFLNSGSVQFGSTAGAASLLARVNGSPIKGIYAYSQPEWTALVTNGGSGIESVEDLAGKKVAVTRAPTPTFSCSGPWLTMACLRTTSRRCCCSMPTAAMR